MTFELNETAPSFLPTPASKASAVATVMDVSGSCEIAVLIPCFNEESTVGTVVSDFRAASPHAHIYVYDNNSTDRTSQVAAEAGAIVRHEEMQGKGHVVRRMFRDIDADFYVLVDGDGTYDAAQAPVMIDKALTGPYDLVNAVRVTDDPGASYRSGHQFGNLMLTGMVQFIFGDRVEDMLSGYKVLSRRFVKSFPALSSGFETETELTVHALELHMPIAHIPSRYSARPPGSVSKLNTFEDGRRIFLAIIDLFKQERPLLFFSGIASVLALISLILAIPVFATYLDTGLVPRLPTAVLTLGLMLLAVISFTSGLILDTVTRGRREAKMLRYLNIPPLQASAAQRHWEQLETMPRTPMASSALSRLALPRAGGADSPDPYYAAATNKWVSVGMLVGSIVVFALLSIAMGQDVNWDLRNYHFYNGYAAVTGTWSQNYLPAQLQSYLVPTLDMFVYLLISHLQPVQVGMVLGGIQGVNFWLVFQIAARLVRLRLQWLQWPIWLGCAVIAMWSPTSHAELGNTMHDLTLSVFILGGLLLLIVYAKARDARFATLLPFLGAGLLFGVATGVKYTEAPYAVAAFVAFVVSTDLVVALKRAGMFALGGALGIIGSAGYWMYAMYARFGNPLFPEYNATFKSPYELPIDFANSPFYPHNMSERLFTPFYFTKVTTHPTLEVQFQNIAFAVIYILLIVVALVQVARLVTGAAGQRSSGDREYIGMRARLVIFFVIGFIAWEQLFSNYRYLSPLELLAPVVVAILVTSLTRLEYLRALLLVTLLGAIGLSMYTANWGRLPWSSSYFPVQVPQVEGNALVVMPSYQPIGYLVPYFPQTVQFVRIQSNYDGIATPTWTAEEHSVIARHAGPFYLMTPDTDEASENAMLRP